MTILNENEKVLFGKAEVKAVNYTGIGKNLYSIKAQLVGSYAGNKIINASPVDYNNIKIPIVGEIVIILVASSDTATNFVNQVKYYYMNTIGIQGNYHNNALPTLANRLKTEKNLPLTYEAIFSSGVTKLEKSSEPSIDQTFPEKTEIIPLQLYSGDILFDGRFGNSLRFTSTPRANLIAIKTPTWGAGISSPGDPLTIISNGRKNVQPLNTESPNTDDSSIWLASGQSIVFTPASNKLSLFYNNKSDGFLKDSNSARQIFITANRIHINAREDNLNIFSKKNIGISSENTLHIESANKIEMDSKKIALGINASHPALLGDVTFDLLNDLIKNLTQLCDELIKEIHPTGVGPSGPPQNAAQYAKIKANLNTIKSKLPDIKSNLVFLNKSYLAEDKVDEKSKTEFNNNKRNL
jgi:hypothetical protein